MRTLHGEQTVWAGRRGAFVCGVTYTGGEGTKGAVAMQVEINLKSHGRDLKGLAVGCGPIHSTEFSFYGKRKFS